ncbi:COG1361 family protein [Adhaeretor mobilis]|uniref:Large cysteine-rich periplasmic protein OmcB n=1 Tax=Adhaeretor mobilis TaxID=1930276 RepID=A0A517MY27_9BACT|nr:DUF11 domain-containing protein [Adhaeretor mobilis]QDS99782.1 Large cysteine-rich periplasmic protein OmcB precursor [Adhaeretor mobilis]
MLRQSIVGLLLLSLCTAVPCQAQNASNSKTRRPSLASRLSSFRDVFRRDDEKPAASNSKLSASGLFGGGNGQEQGNSRPPMPYDPADLKRPATASQKQPRVITEDISVNPRSQVSARVVAPITKPAAEPVAIDTRRSPMFGSRKDELDEALSDLFAPAGGDISQPPAASGREELPSYLQGLVAEEEPEPVSTIKTAANSATKKSATRSTRSNPFDLHGALAPAELTKEATPSAKPELPNVDTAISESLGTISREKLDVIPGPTASPEPIGAETAVEEALTAAMPTPIAVPITVETHRASAETKETNAEEILPTEGSVTDLADSSTSEAQEAFAERVEPVFTESVPVSSGTSALPVQASSNTSLDNPVRQDNVLLSYSQPIIQSYVEGPRRIVVGRESTYRVVLKNSGETSAEKVTATVEVPIWADVVDATSSSGIIERSEKASLADETRQIEWRLHDLAGRSQQTLELRLIPRAGRPLQLGVHWKHAPVGAQAMVEVQEPKLALILAGPSDVLFGRPQLYTLTISNPGTGSAEDVAIQLTPPGGGVDEVINHKVGILAPGESKELELELTARDAGELTVQAAAVAAGDLSAETIKNVLCRKPELEIDWRGPEKKYSGTVATYYFRVRNPGTAATEPFDVKLDLPEGGEFVSASEGGRKTVDGKQVSWKAPALAPGQERFLQLRCQLSAGGDNKIVVVAETANAELRDKETIITNVVALADLKLHVSDPRGPLPVGEPAEYEIRVVNRGTTAAHDVNVTALFSAGIEPISVEGAQHSIRDGRVSFQTIKTLSAGRELTLKIKASAAQPGTHVFRAEVGCPDLDIKLAAEETTRFFKDERRWEDASTAYSGSEAKR